MRVQCNEQLLLTALTEGGGAFAVLTRRYHMIAPQQNCGR